MVLKRIANYLLFWILIHLPNTGAEKVIRAVEGASVHLPCHSPFVDSAHVNVEWKINIADNNCSCKWSIQNKSISTTSSSKDCCSRLTLTTNFTLKIENVQPGDSGNYSCKTSRIIPPPTLDNSSSLVLQIAGLSLERLSIMNDSCVRLLCSLESLNPDLANFTWSREGQKLPLNSTFNANETELHLCKPDWSEGDTIICNVNYLKSQTQKSIKLNSSEFPNKVLSNGKYDLLIYSSCGAAGLVICIIFPVVICKCRKRKESGSIVFSNKVYENFSFAMSRQNAQLTPPPQLEECIYEN